MDRIRMSLRVCQIRLRKTFTTPRFYVALLWIAILFHVMTAGIRGFCEQTGVDVTFWMLPFMTRYNGDQIIIVLGALLLFCDAPFLEPNSGWQILRVGRKSWFWGNMLYIVVVSFFYTICLSMIPVLLVFPNVGWETGWGKVISTLAQTNAAYTFDQEPLDYLIISRFSPQEAMGLTMLAIWCLSVMTGVVSYAGKFSGTQGIWNRHQLRHRTHCASAQQIFQHHNRLLLRAAALDEYCELQVAGIWKRAVDGICLQCLCDCHRRMHDPFVSRDPEKGSELCGGNLKEWKKR